MQMKAGLASITAPPDSSFPFVTSIAPTSVRAVELIRPMRGCSRPWLVRADDGHYYVVKFQNNPQHVRILANEMFAARLARLIGLPVATPAFVEIRPHLAPEEHSLRPELGKVGEDGRASLHFGSCFPGGPETTLVVDFLPDRLLGKVRNRVDAFVGGFVFDKWTCNCDVRQVVFFRSVEDGGQPYSAQLIDHSCCFNAEYWTIADSPIRSLYPRSIVYDSVTSLESFEPFLSRIENLQFADILQCLTDIPKEWCFPNAGELQPLARRLYCRGKRLAQVIVEANVNSHSFRNWI